MREALKRLEQLRLVESCQGDAMRVTDWRAEGEVDVIALALAVVPQHLVTRLIGGRLPIPLWRLRVL